MKLILLGAPGAGKGTQGVFLREHLGIPVISTGDMIRRAIQEETQAGKLAKDFVTSGRLVPDEVVVAMLQERILEPDCQKGFILDGFPRTIPQAQALEAMGIAVDRVIEIDVKDGVIVGRLANRLVCSGCGATYNLKNLPPKIQGVCDSCQKLLGRRADDEPATVTERLRIYHEQTQPLQEYYKARGILYRVEGQETVEATGKLVLSAAGSEAQ